MIDLIHVDNGNIKEIISMAECLGNKKLILVKEIKTLKDLKKWKEEFSKITSDLDLVFGAEIVPRNVNELENVLGQVRKETEIIVVSGGNYDVNRAAVENEMVDILMHPEEDRTDRGLDDYTANQAKKNGVIIGISFRKILESYKKSKAFKLSFITQNINLLDSKNIAVVSDAYSKWELRPAKDMDDFLLTLTKKNVDSTKNLEEKTNKNKKRVNQIHEGVRKL